MDVLGKSGGAAFSPPTVPCTGERGPMGQAVQAGPTTFQTASR
jgi:hypothetical protein